MRTAQGSIGGADPPIGQSASDEQTPIRLTIQMPPTCQSERRHVLKELLSDIHAVDWVDEIATGQNTVIKDASGKHLLFREGIFQQRPMELWRHFRRPACRIPQVLLQDDELEKATGYPDLPVLFGNTEGPPIRCIAPESIEISADLLGGAFWLLARVEEMDEGLADPHGRFPPGKMWLVESGLVLRAVVDEYRSIVNCCLSRLWPNLKITIPDYQLQLSHDMDHPTSRSLGFNGFVRQVGRDILRRKAPWVAIRRLLSGLGLPNSESIDPGSGMTFLLATAERIGLHPRFYWMVQEGAAPLDGRYPLASGPALRMLHRAVNAGHPIGIHPGYYTYKNFSLLARQIESFSRILDGIGASTFQLAGRQHYLRWRPETWSHYCRAGITRDGSLGFSDRVGFRCGTARPYHAFDLERHESLPLIVEPLHVMDTVICREDFRGWDPKVHADLMTMYRAVQRFGGNLSILWHNNLLSTELEKMLMVKLMFSVKSGG